MPEPHRPCPIVARQRGKSDTLDAERIARDMLAHSLLPRAFKRAGPDRGPDPQHELLRCVSVSGARF